MSPRTSCALLLVMALALSASTASAQRASHAQPQRPAQACSSERPQRPFVQAREWPHVWGTALAARAGRAAPQSLSSTAQRRHGWPDPG